MQLYLDSANIFEVKKLASINLIHGITTNPSLIKKAAGNFSDEHNLESYLIELAEASPGPVSIEVISTDKEGMYSEGMKLHDIFSREKYYLDKLVVKIPICTATEIKSENWDSGLEATKRLADKGIKVNSTLVFTPSQAMLAAYAGASYVSPFAGRIDDALRNKFYYGTKNIKKSDYFPKNGLKHFSGAEDNEGSLSGVHLVERIVNALKGTGCKVLAASLRNPRQVAEMAEVGADIATVPYEVIISMAKHQLTCDGIKSFEADTIDEYRKLFEKKE